jgi:hypothetical protein
MFGALISDRFIDERLRGYRMKSVRDAAQVFFVLGPHATVATIMAANAARMLAQLIVCASSAHQAKRRARRTRPLPHTLARQCLDQVEGGAMRRRRLVSSQ